MKELKTITEHQLLMFAYYSLFERIVHEKEVNERTKKEYGRDNSISQHRLEEYNKQLAEVCERILEIEHNSAE